jgi:hypothetical protein
MDRKPDSVRSLPRVDPHASYSERFRSVRQTTRALAAPLSAEDCAIQSMPDASPVKWHLAHTTWFFETFLLKRQQADYRIFDRHYGYLFNSTASASAIRVRIATCFPAPAWTMSSPIGITLTRQCSNCLRAHRKIPRRAP